MDSEDHDDDTEMTEPASYDSVSRVKNNKPKFKCKYKYKYRECLKNHAVGVGGHALDGCGEFLPAGPDALQCAACNCHRNFHRKAYRAPPSGYLHVAPHQRLLALPSPSSGGGETGRKRFRTKFTQEQKDGMVELAERLGWRIQKQDEPAVEQFCNDSGVERRVLKVWMHNNKHTIGMKP